MPAAKTSDAVNMCAGAVPVGADASNTEVQYSIHLQRWFWKLMSLACVTTLGSAVLADEQETQPGSARAEQAHTATAAAAAGGGGLPTLPSTASTAASGVKPLLAAAGGGSSGGPAREVPYLDRVRAVCALLKIGDAQQLLEGKQDAMRAALAAVKNGQAFK
jgi:hypothetical protein